MASANLSGAFEIVRRTAAAHASAIDALERAAGAEAVLLARDRQKLEEDHISQLLEAESQRQRDRAFNANDRAEIAQLRLELDKDRAFFLDEQSKICSSAPPPDEVIRLNVGGYRFETSRAVLTKVDDSMLGRMFGRCAEMVQCGEDGSVFIDRDGALFAVVLDFLRDLDSCAARQAIRSQPEALRAALLRELDFFGLETAVFGTWPWVEDALFRPGPELKNKRACCAAVFVDDVGGGRVFAFGGLAGSFTLRNTEVLDVGTLTITQGPNLLQGRSGCAAVRLDGERVLVVGGFSDGSYLATTEILHLPTLTFSSGPTLLSRRGDCAVVQVDAHRFLVCGGVDGRSRLASTEILHFNTFLFTPGPLMATPRQRCCAVALDEFQVLVAGGRSGSRELHTTEVLDVPRMLFQPGPNMATARDGCSAAVIDPNHVFVVGGKDANQDSLSSTEVLDVSTMTFSAGPALKTGRGGCCAVLLESAGAPRVWVCGGDDGGSEMGSEVASTELLAVEEGQGPRSRPARDDRGL